MTRRFSALAFATLVALCGPVAAEPIKKAVASGRVLKVFFAASLNADCTSIGQVSIRLTGGPRHGVVTTRNASDFPYFPPSNDRSRCNIRRVRGLVVSYRPDRGYVGADSFNVNYLFPTGNEIPTDYEIEVK